MSPVIVTGAASGIGAAVAASLVRSETPVAAFDRDPVGLERLAAELGCFTRTVDVGNERAVGEAVADAERALGPTRGLVLAAGVLRGGPVAAATPQLRELLEVNVLGVQNVLAAVAPGMAERGRGAIVTVASNAASTPRIHMGAYCASKAAASMLTRSWALELASSGVWCNVVCPGSTDTPMLRAMLDGADLESLVTGAPERFRLGIPNGRVASPQDVVEVVLFLLSERARHVIGQEVKVDGGATL